MNFHADAWRRLIFADCLLTAAWSDKKGAGRNNRGSQYTILLSWEANTNVRRICTFTWKLFLSGA